KLLRAVAMASAAAAVLTFATTGSANAIGSPKWTIVSAPTGVPLSTSTYIFNNGISCAAANACSIVGSAEDASYNYTALADRWNGGLWTTAKVAPVVVPGHGQQAGASFESVSCLSPADCFAVGSYYLSDSDYTSGL